MFRIYTKNTIVNTEIQELPSFRDCLLFCHHELAMAWGSSGYLLVLCYWRDVKSRLIL
jgi:hypothetical protein